MTFEQEITAIDNLAKSCRDRAQANDLLAQEVAMLKQECTSLSTALTYKSQELDKAVNVLTNTDARLCTEIRNNGELTATLKQLLAEQMALASRAADMLRSLEEKPKPVLIVPPKTDQPIATAGNPYKQPPAEVSEKLAPYIAKDKEDLKVVPIGRTFTLDPPLSEDVTDRGVKWWYRLLAGSCPQNYLRDRPGVECKMEKDGPVFIKFVANEFVANPTKEEREPIPFRTEELQETSNSFSDNGEDVPKFLKQGPKYDADQRNQP